MDNVSQIYLFALLHQHLIVGICNKPQYPQAVISDIISTVNLVKMLSNLAERIFMRQLICHEVVQVSQQLLELKIYLIIEIALVEFNRALLLLYDLYLLTDLVNLIDDLLDVGASLLILLFCLSLRIHVEFLQLFSPNLFIILRLSRFIFVHVVLLHLF